MAQTLFQALKQQYPDTQIDVLAPQWSRPLTERMPEISGSLSLPFKHGELKWRDRYALGKSLRNQYQRCFVLPNSFKSALVPFWANIPERMGWLGEWRYGLLNKTRRLNKQKYLKMVSRYVALAYFDANHDNNVDSEASLPCFKPRLTVNREKAQEALACYQLDLEKPCLVLCPGAEFGPSKRWPEKYYGALAAQYLRSGWQVWIFGSNKDSVVANAIQAITAHQCIDLTGRTSLGEAIDLMSFAQAVVSNDSGLMHIAAALERPLVAVYGSTDPGYTPPLSNNAIIVREKTPCSPCFKRVCPLGHHACMEKIGVESVTHALKTVGA